MKSTFSVFDHLIVPTLKVVDLFFFTPLEFNVPLIYGLSIGYPLLYLAVSMVRGHFVHFYPYWFINPSLIPTYALVGIVIALVGMFVFFVWAFLKLSRKVEEKRSVQLSSILVYCVCSLLHIPTNKSNAPPPSHCAVVVLPLDAPAFPEYCF